MQTQIWLLLKFCTPKLSDLTAPKILYTKVVNKMAYANNADPDLTASKILYTKVVRSDCS